MDWSRWRNPVKNFVNLGGLYKRPFVEDPFKSASGIRPGWAYFEDGSIFFARFPYTNGELQEVMKVAADFVRNPTDGRATLQTIDHSNSRMILLERRRDKPVAGPPNIHLYARYVQNNERLLAARTQYSAINLELDSMRSGHVSTKFEIGQETTTPAVKGSGFLLIDKWIKSASTFRGTLIDGVLQPGVRLDNGLSFTLPKTAAAAQEQAPGEENHVERDAPNSVVHAEWQREYTQIGFKDFASAISVDPPLDSSLGLDLRRGFDPLESTEGALSLREHELDLRQREGELKRLMRTLFWKVELWHTNDLKSAAAELERQKAKLELRLEAQLVRQEAWDRCEDDALKRANLAEREFILKAEITQLKWMQANWLWFTKLHKMEGMLKRLREANQELKKRENAIEKRLRKPGYKADSGNARERGDVFATTSGGKARRTDVSQEPASKSTRPNIEPEQPVRSNRDQEQPVRSNRDQEQPVRSNAEAMAIFEFLNESHPATPDALEMFHRANGKP